MSMYSKGGESSSIPDSCGEGEEITGGWSGSYAAEHKQPSKAWS